MLIFHSGGRGGRGVRMKSEQHLKFAIFFETAVGAVVELQLQTMNTGWHPTEQGDTNAKP